MMQYVSITGGGNPVDFKTAVLKGIADDKGLFVPAEMPNIPLDQLKSWQGLGYQGLAKKLLRLLIPESAIPTPALENLVDKSFETFYHDEIIPHYQLQGEENIVIQELFHGPTLSFKDIAMGFVVNLFDYFLEQDKQRKTIMVATSGDTGPAAAFASIGKKNIQTWLIYPVGGISEEQRRQMTCILDNNVLSVGVENCKSGSDDCDAMITSLFSDQQFRDEMRLSSVNSINWARVMTQTVHYFYGYLQNVQSVGDPVNFSVPCGAFGNMCAGFLAKKMGLPVHKFIVCDNINGVLSEAFEYGRLVKRELVRTFSSAIDIIVPLNFWRFLYFSLNENNKIVRSLWNEYCQAGIVNFSEEQHRQFSQGFLFHKVTDDETVSLIREVYESCGNLLDPQGAVAVQGAKYHVEALKEHKTICLATAHPSKFPDVIKTALGQIPLTGKHHSLEANRTRCERIILCNFEKWQQQLPPAMKSLSLL